MNGVCSPWRALSSFVPRPRSKTGLPFFFSQYTSAQHAQRGAAQDDISNSYQPNQRATHYAYHGHQSSRKTLCILCAMSAEKPSWPEVHNHLMLEVT